MVSSNAGSWSNKDTSKNNKVMAFEFYEGDKIHMHVDMATKKVTFNRNQGANTYELSFDTIDGDKLYPCALFYFNND